MNGKLYWELKSNIKQAKEFNLTKYFWTMKCNYEAKQWLPLSVCDISGVI